VACFWSHTSSKLSTKPNTLSQGTILPFSQIIYHLFHSSYFAHLLGSHFQITLSHSQITLSHSQITLSHSLTTNLPTWQVERNWSPVATNTSGATRRGATTTPSCNQFQKMVNLSQEASSSSSFPHNANVRLRRAGRGSMTPFWTHSQRSTDMPRWTSHWMHGPNKYHGSNHSGTMQLIWQQEEEEVGEVWQSFTWLIGGALSWELNSSS
jgi:hypothetical protein